MWSNLEILSVGGLEKSNESGCVDRSDINLMFVKFYTHFNDTCIAWHLGHIAHISLLY